jgi:hypothetical protein
MPNEGEVKRECEDGMSRYHRELLIGRSVSKVGDGRCRQSTSSLVSIKTQRTKQYSSAVSDEPIQDSLGSYSWILY